MVAKQKLRSRRTPMPRFPLLDEESAWREAAKRSRFKEGIIPREVRDRINPTYVWAARQDSTGLRNLINQVRLMRDGLRAEHRRRKTTFMPPVEMRPLLDPRESKRSEVLSHELARLARRYGEHSEPANQRYSRSRIRAFREDYLDGRILSPAEAGAFIDSDALRWLDLASMRNEGVPLVGHSATTAPPEYIRAERSAFLRRRLRITWNDQARDVVSDQPFPSPGERLAFYTASGSKGEAEVGPNSVLGIVAQLARELSKHYLWDEAEATWFVLTDEAPRTPCFRASQEGGGRNDHYHVRLNLSIYLWVSAKTVMRAFRQWQREHLGKENRHISVERLAMCDFVYERRHRDVPWREILKEWRKSHRKQAAKYKGENGIRNFRRDAEQVYHLLLRGQ